MKYIHVDGCGADVHHTGDDGAKLFEQVATSKNNPWSHSKLKAKSEDAIQVRGFTEPSSSPVEEEAASRILIQREDLRSNSTAVWTWL